jgi:hypothetical protein
MGLHLAALADPPDAHHHSQHGHRVKTADGPGLGARLRQDRLCFGDIIQPHGFEQRGEPGKRIAETLRRYQQGQTEGGRAGKAKRCKARPQSR